MEKGDICSIRITDRSTAGEGIGRIDNAVTFVPGLVPGDEAEVEITEVRKNILKARKLTLTTPSPDRAEPACSHFKDCGGCALLDMQYPAQLELKNKQLRDRLTRLCGADLPAFDEPAGMEEPFHYRNKAEYAISAGPVKEKRDGSKYNTGKLRIGFYDRKSHRVIDAPDCMLQTGAARMAAEGLRRYIKESGTTVYDERTGKGRLRRMTVRTGFDSGEVMVTLTINAKKLAKPQLLADILSECIAEPYELRSIAVEYNTGRSLAKPGKFEVIAGSEVIQDTLEGMKFEISPQSFYQVNPAQTKVLYETVLEFADPGPEDVVYDLYCGVGTIGLFCARRARYVWGIESVKKAIVDANRNAVINGLVNIQFMEGRAEEKIAELTEQADAPDIVILDPPRSGCRPELLEAVLEAAPDRIVYVSCDPATMARDLRILTGQNPESGEAVDQTAPYEIRRVRMIDQFCQTMHMETVVLLSKVQK